ncbi:glutaminase [Streptomyces sp. A7024]|uniref:Glutaminase n=1 Tax=Streptomyces coryli TaxID=1128680 RepID=A0A6G4U5H3_9ACTN|nr:glutaminase [Streptomyces coryli]NGN67343.1 glutaminase [Streptomyces coryli]
MDFQAVVDQVHQEVTPHIGEGKVADYIPELATVDPKQFGFAVATVDGTVHSAGDVRTPFAIESISKVFALALVLGKKDSGIWDRVHREPSGTPFNSLIQLELEQGIPRNPYINPGAIVVTDQLLTDSGDALAAMRALLRAETGDAELDVDSVTAASEARTGDRNRALAYLMASFGNMRNRVDDSLDHYFRQCSLAITCEQLAKAGLLVARHGVRADGGQLMEREDARHIIALMTTCGTYDAAGEFAYRIGLPCKSGVGGGILAVMPDQCAIAAWGPGLDVHGNSVTGAMALESFVRATGDTVF